jgi:hypothetical protein
LLPKFAIIKRTCTAVGRQRVEAIFSRLQTRQIMLFQSRWTVSLRRVAACRALARLILSDPLAPPYNAGLCKGKIWISPVSCRVSLALSLQLRCPKGAESAKWADLPERSCASSLSKRGTPHGDVDQHDSRVRLHSSEPLLCRLRRGSTHKLTGASE